MWHIRGDPAGMIWIHMVHMVHIWHTYMVNIVRIVTVCTAHCTENEIGNRLNGDSLSQSKNQRHSV